MFFERYRGRRRVEVQEDEALRGHMGVYFEETLTEKGIFKFGLEAEIKGIYVCGFVETGNFVELRDCLVR